MVNLFGKTILLLRRHEFRTRHQVLACVLSLHSHSYSVTYYYVTALTSQSSRPKRCAAEIPTWGLWWKVCDAIICHFVVYITYHDQDSVSSINLKFRKKILQIWSSNKNYSIQYILKGEKLYGANYVTMNKSFIKFVRINFGRKLPALNTQLN